MSSDKFRNAPETDVLQINMDNISKELCDLMVTCEKDLGTHQYNANGVVNVTRRSAGNIAEPQQASSMLYQRMEHVFPPTTQAANTKMSSCKPIVKHNLNLANTHNLQFPNSQRSNPITIGPTYPHVSGARCIEENDPKRSTPKYEVHYLRPTEAVKLTSPPLISLPAKDETGGRRCTGTYRKYSRFHTKYNFKPQNGTHDYKNIVVDMSVLGVTKDGKESNPVLRLFALFRGLHDAIVEVPFPLEPPCDSVYEPTFAPLPKSTMPCTMNVQHQVKYASGKVISFLGTMQRLLVANMMYDQSLAEECERYLVQLRQILSQFDMYKRVDLEHKRGQFISEEVCAHGQHLEKLLEQITQQIREVHVRVIALDWFIGMKHRGETGVKNDQLVNIDGNAPLERSNIGVINEILQMCNTPMSTMETNIGTTTIQNTRDPLELNNSDDKINSTINTINNENNDEFMTAAGATCLPTVNTHFRQPVFYIG